MQNLTCIICPIGCSLDIEEKSENLSVTGNKCPRGAVYALEEISAPKRVVTATAPVATACSIRRVPVKTVSPCPRELIPALLCDIYKTAVKLPVTVGDVIIADWQNKGIDVIATRTINQI
jgi:CxxC motif-containing protein